MKTASSDKMRKDSERKGVVRTPDATSAQLEAHSYRPELAGVGMVVGVGVAQKMKSRPWKIRKG